jgi:hypothetical protein
VRLVGRGDDRIRATHTKTLELTVDAAITERATCVLAVAVHPEPAQPLAGPVRITISAGGESFSLQAQANSSWDPAGSAVVRRSPLRLPGTLATHADAASSDLPRSLVAALRAPGTVVEVTVQPERTQQRTVVLYAADPTRPFDARLQAELNAADTVLAEDAGARALVGRATPTAGGPRVLVVATRDLPGRSVLADLSTVPVETVGLPARLAAASASPSRGPLLLAPDDADPRELLRTTPAGHRLVLTTEADRLPALLALALDVRGSATATLAQEYAPPLPVVDGQVPELPSQDIVHICFGPADERTALDPNVRAAIAHLLEDGVATKTAAKALADLTGLSRRDAYDVVMTLR